ncbi:SURF1 [Cordylochernes scorpioides]|uniref:SURF1-like protein n=1 Tax=Cordylochernes scorpioides TaxID=51811 RepID=A0ABY6KE77_9ARAC|nr:SURF1 [Cordylochernes scorpioides]
MWRTIASVRKVQSSAVELKKYFNKARPPNALEYSLLIFPGTFLALGTWQIQRLKWKEDLIAKLKERTAMAPIELPEDLRKLEDMEYYPVVVRGHYDHSREVFIKPRTLHLENAGRLESGIMSSPKHGAHVITPFMVSGRNEEILINRGWVPTSHLNPKTRESGQVTGEVSVVGLVRKSDKRPPLGKKQLELDNKSYLYRDIDAIAFSLGTAPVMLDAIEGGRGAAGRWGEARAAEVQVLAVWAAEVQDIRGHQWGRVVRPAWGWWTA